MMLLKDLARLASLVANFWIIIRTLGKLRKLAFPLACDAWVASRTSLRKTNNSFIFED